MTNAHPLTRLTHPDGRGNVDPVREGANARIVPISSDVLCCPTCRSYFSAAVDHQRYCKPSCRVTGCKKRRKRLTEAFVVIATTMSAGRISAERAADMVEWNAERCEQVVAAWGWGFDGKDELVRTSA